jgi:hypothetical protein
MGWWFPRSLVARGWGWTTYDRAEPVLTRLLHGGARINAARAGELEWRREPEESAHEFRQRVQSEAIAAGRLYLVFFTASSDKAT